MLSNPGYLDHSCKAHAKISSISQFEAWNISSTHKTRWVSSAEPYLTLPWILPALPQHHGDPPYFCWTDLFVMLRSQVSRYAHNCILFSTGKAEGNSFFGTDSAIEIRGCFPISLRRFIAAFHDILVYNGYIVQMSSERQLIPLSRLSSRSHHSDRHFLFF